MRLTEGRDESKGLIGLTFEPLEDRGITEISGTLWVDPATGELQWLDYRYEELDVPNRERLGGRVSFDGLPNGTWIVRAWSIRMPRLAATRTQRGSVRTELTGIKEEGGLIVRVSNVQGEVVLDSRAGIVEGVVMDSAGVAPVADAVESTSPALLSGVWQQLPILALAVSEAGLEWESEIVLPIEDSRRAWGAHVHRPVVVLCDAGGVWLDDPPLGDLAETESDGSFSRSIITVKDVDRYLIEVSHYFF